MLVVLSQCAEWQRTEIDLFATVLLTLVASRGVRTHVLHEEWMQNT